MNIWIAIAFVVCAAGLVIGGPFQMGELGKMIFLLGFGLGIVGVLIGTFRMSLSKSPTRAIRGIMILPHDFGHWVKLSCRITSVSDAR